jgi:hypothetical protein
MSSSKRMWHCILTFNTFIFCCVDGVYEILSWRFHNMTPQYRLLSSLYLKGWKFCFNQWFYFCDIAILFYHENFIKCEKIHKLQKFMKYKFNIFVFIMFYVFSYHLQHILNCLPDGTRVLCNWAICKSLFKLFLPHYIFKFLPCKKTTIADLVSCIWVLCATYDTQ